MENKIKEILNQMTLEEKASMCSGSSFWETEGIERLGIPKILVTDGPHGMRKQEGSTDQLGLNDSVPATCFPSGVGLAASWNKQLIEKVGGTLAKEAKSEKVSVLLGPAVNIKRSPLCGRNFEYLSEDPYLAGYMGKHHIKGMQAEGVGTSIKHFAANNQEERRFSVDTIVDERTLREIYLPGFEIAVKEEQPWTIMGCYNKVNGVYGCENPYLLTKVLREEWGFEGIVVTDWGANNDRVEGVKAGQDLEMPANGGLNDKKIVEAVNNETLKMEELDLVVERMLRFVFKAKENVEEGIVFDKEAHHDFAKEVALESAVLLKNEDVLPLDRNMKVALIGELADKPRFQGGGSSHINPTFMTKATQEMAKYGDVHYARGYELNEEEVNTQLVQEAIALAKSSDVVVVHVGLPENYESEGYDRKHMQMPPNQNQLISELVKYNKKVVVVLSNGSPIEMPWTNDVAAIFEGYLGGQSGAAAMAELLYGKANPSGKLAETFPLKLEHNPSYGNFPGEGDRVEYKEGIFVGYRYYDKKKLPVLYPFGHGLSYTNFEYIDISLDKTQMEDTEELKVSVVVKNTGKVPGREIIQLYVSDVESSVEKAPKELKGFEKVALAPGEEKTVEFVLDKRSFAYYNTNVNDWWVESGEYMIQVGGSSAHTPLQESVVVENKIRLNPVVELNTPFIDYSPEQMNIVMELFSQTPFGAKKEEQEANSNDVNDNMMQEMMKFMSLRMLQGFAGIDGLEEILNQLNANSH